MRAVKGSQATLAKASEDKEEATAAVGTPWSPC